jgi:hypothetical protein
MEFADKGNLQERIKFLEELKYLHIQKKFFLSIFKTCKYSFIVEQMNSKTLINQF